MPGFRVGKVPMGMIKKLYGRTIMVDEINKLISDNLTKYIVDNKLNLLGEPLPSEKEQKEIDWDNQENFEFAYDYAIAPEVKINLSKIVNAFFSSSVSGFLIIFPVSFTRPNLKASVFTIGVIIFFKKI